MERRNDDLEFGESPDFQDLAVLRSRCQEIARNFPAFLKKHGAEKISDFFEEALNREPDLAAPIASILFDKHEHFLKANLIQHRLLCKYILELLKKSGDYRSPMACHLLLNIVDISDGGKNEQLILDSLDGILEQNPYFSSAYTCRAAIKSRDSDTWGQYEQEVDGKFAEEMLPYFTSENNSAGYYDISNSKTLPPVLFEWAEMVARQGNDQFYCEVFNHMWPTITETVQSCEAQIDYFVQLELLLQRKLTETKNQGGDTEELETHLSYLRRTMQDFVEQDKELAALMDYWRNYSGDPSVPESAAETNPETQLAWAELESEFASTRGVIWSTIGET